MIKTWTLIVVTMAGNVSHSPNFADKHLCLEAKSLAETRYAECIPPEPDHD